MFNGLLIGRFQPFHLGHLAALKFALNTAEHLWVGIGSSNKPIEQTNPFTVSERREMILSSINNDDHMSTRVSIYAIPDVNNHIKWLELIDKIVPPFNLVFTNDDLTEHLYSKRTDVKIIRIPFLNRDQLSGTQIRDMIKRQDTQNDSDQNWQNLVPSGTLKILLQCDAKSRLANL